VFDQVFTTQSAIITGLSASKTYTFVVQSRNVIAHNSGFSANSAEINIKAAQVPDSPTDLVNVPEVTQATQVGLQWVAPVFNGGSSVLDY